MFNTNKLAIVVLAIAIALACVVGGLVFWGTAPSHDTFTITYETDGGTLGEGTPTNFTPGDVLTIPPAQKDGSVFDGWYLDPNYDTQFKGNTKGLRGSITLYAKWTPDLTGHEIVLTKSGSYNTGSSNYTITGQLVLTYLYFNAEKGAYYMSVTDTTVTTDVFGRSSTDTDTYKTWETYENNLDKVGTETLSTIHGDVVCDVYSQSDLTSSQKQWIGQDDGVLYKALTYKKSLNFLYQTTRQVNYTCTSDTILHLEPTIKVNVVADTGVTVTGQEGLFYEGQTVTLVATLGDGEEFRGWFKNGEVVSTDTTYSFIVTKDVSLEAKVKQWFDVTYELYGGTANGDLPGKYSPGADLILPTAQLEGMIFAGWYLDSDYEQQFTGDTESLYGNITLYAGWAENLSGHSLTMSKSGYTNRGFNSYTMTGQLTYTYLYYNVDKGSYYIRNEDSTTYTYKYLGTSYSESSSDLYWSSEIEGTFQKLGTETISVVVDGKTQQIECEVTRLTYPDGGTETKWSSGWITYKVVYHYSSSGLFMTNETEITYTYMYDTFVEIESDCVIDVYCGKGISVSGLKDMYQLGETADLTVTTDKGTEFDGWFDSNFNLLSKDREYKLIVGGSQTMFATNTESTDIVLDSDVPIDMDGTFGMNDADYVIINMDTKATDTFDGEVYVFNNGGKYRVLAKDEDSSRYFDIVVYGAIERTFEWKYEKRTYTITMDINYEDLLYARDLYSPDDRWTDTEAHDRSFVTLSYEDPIMKPYMADLVDKLIEEYRNVYTTTKVSEITFLGYILAFTQYIEYQSDEEYMGLEEYWKFPLETLYDQGGDCEDTSILFCAIAHQCREPLGLSYRTAIELLPGHMTGAIKLSGYSYKYTTNPDGYIYCETTTTDYEIGEIPSEMYSYFTQSYYYWSGYSSCIEVA